MTISQLQDIRRLEVPRDDSLLMSVISSRANIGKQLQALIDVQAVPIAIISDPQPLHELHDKVGSSFAGRAGIKDASDIGVLHQRQCLSFVFESSNHVA